MHKPFWLTLTRGPLSSLPSGDTGEVYFLEGEVESRSGSQGKHFSILGLIVGC